MQRLHWFSMAMALLIATSVFAVRPPSYTLPRSTTPAPVIGGAQDPVVPNRYVMPRPGHPRGNLDYPTYVAGSTWYDYQHNGSAGKMVAVDSDGFVHLVWMDATTSDPLNGPRQVQYNVWDPTNSTWLWNGGVQIDSSLRAGFVCQAVLPGGTSFPAFHEVISGISGKHAAVAQEFGPRTGEFVTMPIPGNSAVQTVWPKVCIGLDSTVYVVMLKSPLYDGLPYPFFYSRGHPVWDSQGRGLGIQWDVFPPPDSGFMPIDTLMDVSPIVVASPNPGSNRVAIVWTRVRDRLPIVDSAGQWDNDVAYMISEDGGRNWGHITNITHFADPDVNCASHDTLVCDRDTARAFNDVDALFDLGDHLHIAFTTDRYYALAGARAWSWSDIWHWSEQYGEMTNLAHGEFVWNPDSMLWYNAGGWQLMLQRPSLSLDRSNGYLYCSMWRYDTTQVSAGGWPSSMAYIAMSRNCGRSWSEAVCVTPDRADPPVDTPAGSCRSHRDITIADHVDYQGGTGYIDLEYILDFDAGSFPQTEGVATLDSVVFVRIPIDSIPPTPIHSPYWPALHVDSTDFPGRRLALDPNSIAPCPTIQAAEPREDVRPESFRLYQNYPNPFNPTTNIQFDLVRDARVSLKVYNVLGQVVATLYDNQWVTAGVQRASFDASNLASGVYIYRLNVAGHSQALKMVVMK